MRLVALDPLEKEAGMTHKALMSTLMLVVMTVVMVGAQTYAPIVAMSITLPDGQTKELTAPESGLATLTLKDGTAFGFRPTIQDDRPWSKVTVAVFKMPTATQATQLLGEVDVKTGATAVPSKTTPIFKIAVTKVLPPAAATPTS
ncbi:MAG: hypothetical protein DMF95_05510 [Acidobacteria bacterium]|nr:MAG: hypothetical protein DMF95_05510 [Acidobacteriota bacterium]